METKGYLVSGHDNGHHFFEDRTDVRRCAKCAELLDKWNETLHMKKPPAHNYDVSCSYDGVTVVSSRFKMVYDDNRLSGLVFKQLQNGYYAILSNIMAKYDTDRSSTRFVDQCTVCRRWKSVVGSPPDYLVKGASVPERGFAQTDIEFASGDEKSPLLICGKTAVAILRKAKFIGLDLSTLEGKHVNLNDVKFPVFSE